MTDWLRQRGEEFGLVLGLLTRLPVPRFEVRTGATLASGFWAFPLCGAFVGALAGLVGLLAVWAGLGSVASAIVTVGAMVLASGALHEDGLADFWDGIGGGETRERRLEIMRDSRIGTYGAIALGLTLALIVSLLAPIFTADGRFESFAVLISLGAASRAAVVAPLVLLRPARTDGLAALMGVPPVACMVAAVGLAGAIAVGATGWAGLALLGGAASGALVISALARRYLGGATGDVYGAAILTAFATGLLAMRIFT